MSNGLNIVRVGSGDPLLMIMGVSGTHVSWGTDLLGRLEPDFDCITYDHRGVGRSAPLDGPFTVRDLADDAAAVLDELDVHSAHVFGVSMGGMVAQELALAHPDRVRSLILGCTSAGGRESLLEGPTFERLDRARAAGHHEQALRIMFELNVSADYAAEPAHFAEFRSSTLAVPVSPTTIGYQASAAKTHDARSRLAQLAPPCLVVHGDQDQVVPVVEGLLLVGLVPDVRLHVLPGVGHGFWWEQPEFVATLIREHIALATEGKTHA